MTRPGIEPRSPGPLANALLIKPTNELLFIEYKHIIPFLFSHWPLHSQILADYLWLSEPVVVVKAAILLSVPTLLVWSVNHSLGEITLP